MELWGTVSATITTGKGVLMRLCGFFGTVGTGLAVCLVSMMWTASSGSAEAACVRGVASNDVLNMRAYASTSAEIVGAIRPGRCGVRIRDRSGNWLRVSVGGYTGWVNGRYIRDESDGDEGDHISSACVRGVADNDVLNIRSRPTSSSRIVGIIKPGRCGVQVFHGQGNWRNISYRGVRGWVNRRYLTR